MIDPLAVNLADPDSVAEAILHTMWTWDTSIDTSPADASRRAIAWMTTELGADTQSFTPQHVDAEWTTLTSHDGYTTVTGLEDVTEAGVGDDTATTARRSYALTYISTGRDGWVGAEHNPTVFLTLANHGAGWQLSAITVA